MTRIGVESSAIDSIGYDKLREILEIEFNTGKIYKYFNVPRHVFSELVSAQSVGKTFNEVVANNYKYVQE